METEYKYSVADTRVFDDIISDESISKYIKRDSLEDIKMHAVYFDTDDESLRKAGIAYRIRYENDRITATIKWDKSVSNGLHMREEFNLVINDENFAENPDIDAFKSSDAYDVVLAAAGHRKLLKTVDMKFNRRQVKLDTGKSISALSVDDGFIYRGGREIPIRELEIEWYYGDDEDFNKISSDIATKYKLEPENVSKLQRAFL